MQTVAYKRLTSMWLVLSFFVIGGALTAQAGWNYTSSEGDWAGSDYDCSKGPIPKPENCTEISRGTVAVCWLNRNVNSGMCPNMHTWCTYKTVKLTDPQNGTNKGHVFVCR